MISAWILALAPTLAAIPAEEFVVLADDWARPRSGEVVVAQPAIRQAVNAWGGDASAQIHVVYPGGERGTLWGREVHDWLVALGVSPRHIVLQPGGPRDDAVILRVGRRP
jgi:hypothetical protein